MSPTSSLPRIALYLDSLPMGGSELVTLHLARGFLGQGFGVDLVLGAAVGSLTAEVPTGVRVVELAGRLTPRGASFRDETLRMILGVAPLAAYLRRERPSVLVAAKSHGNVSAVLAGKLAGFRGQLIITEHTYLTGELPSQEAARRTLKNRVLSKVYPHAGRIVTVSGGAADDLSAVTGIARERIDVVYNPVLVPGLAAKAEQPLDHPWFAPGQPPVIVGSGRLTTQKDFPTFLRAFALLRERVNARLMLLGDGPERPRIEQLIRELGLQDHVALPGFVSNPYPYLKGAAVFAYSSVWESFGLVLIEALAVGTPVVSTACGAPQEILQGGRLGRLVPVGDPQALAGALLAALQEPAPPVSEQDLEPFTLDAAVRQYLALTGLPFSPVRAEGGLPAGVAG